MSPEKIRAAVIGTGWGTRVPLPVFSACPDIKVVAVCSEHREKAEEAARRFNVPRAFTDYRELLKQGNLDVVSIASPPFLHHPMTLAALEAGKHVLCEKPMAMDSKQAREMYDRAVKSGLLHMIDFERRFFPTRAKMKELVEAGYIGELYQVNITKFVWGLRVAPVDLHWDWFSQKDKGGGVLQASGSHYIDALRWWFGEMASVCAQLDTFIKERRPVGSLEKKQVETEDAFTFMVRFRQGALALVSLNSVAWCGNGERIEAYGSEGTLVIDSEERLWGSRRGKGKLELIPLTLGEPPFKVEDDISSIAFAFLTQEMVKAIRGSKQASPNFYDGLKCQEVMDAIRRSAVEKVWVDLPPD